MESIGVDYKEEGHELVRDRKEPEISVELELSYQVESCENVVECHQNSERVFMHGNWGSLVSDGNLLENYGLLDRYYLDLRWVVRLILNLLLLGLMLLSLLLLPKVIGWYLSSQLNGSHVVLVVLLELHYMINPIKIQLFYI